MTLEQIGDWFGGGTPNTGLAEYWEGGTIPWFSPKDMKCLRLTEAEDNITERATQQTNVKPFPKGVVLTVVRSGILSRTLPVGVSEVVGTMNQDLKGIHPLPGIEPYFIAYQLMSQERAILDRCCKDGTTVASIDVRRFRSYTVAIAPTEEQRRIVAKIEELFSDLDAGVAALERVRSNLKRYRATVLKAAVEGKLTEDWRAQHPDTEPASVLLERILTQRSRQWEKDQLAKFAQVGKQPRDQNWKLKYELPPKLDNGVEHREPLPKSWTWATIGQLYEVKYGLSEPLSKQAPDSPDDIPVLRIANVTEYGSLNIDQLKYFPVPRKDRPKLLLNKGDLLFNWRNAPNLIGKTAVFDIEGEYVNASFLLRLRPPLPSLDGRFSWIVLNLLRLRGYFSLIANAAVNQSNFNASRTSTVEMPLPPLAEQIQISAEVDRRLSIVDEIEAQVEANVKRGTRLRQGILKRAFEGRLVPQDPTDKPAEELLEHIRQQRLAATPADNCSPRTGQRRRPRKGGSTLSLFPEGNPDRE